MGWNEKKYTRDLEIKKSLAQEILNSKRKETESMHIPDSVLIEAMQEYADIYCDRYLDLYISGSQYALDKIFENGQQNVECQMGESLARALNQYKKKE